MRRPRVLKTRYFQRWMRAHRLADDLLALCEDQIDDQTKSGAFTEIIG